MRQKLLTILALLLMAVSGAWADNPNWVRSGDTWDEDTKTLTVNSNPGTFYYGNENIIENLIIGDGVTSIVYEAFSLCYSLMNVTIGNNVESIGIWAFYNCYSLKNVTIGSGVTSIGNEAFYKCSSLASITIPASVTTIGTKVFYGCTNLATITVDDGNTKYDSRNNCNAVIETTSNTLVAGCKGTTILNTVTSIGENAFFNCTGLTSINIPASVTTIGNSAFEDCTNLATFSGCEGLTYVGKKAFKNTAWLNAQPDGVIYIGKVAYLGKEVSGEISINPGTVSIADEAFKNYDLTSVTIPASVTSIGKNAFDDCRYMTTVTFAAGSQLTSIGENAFQKCTGLTSITIPASVTSIGENAFYNCTGLTSITIPAGVTSIGNGAFKMSNLESVTVYASTPPTLGDDVFFGCTNDLQIYVFSDFVNVYKDADKWDYYDRDDGIKAMTNPNGSCGAKGHESDVRWVLTGESPNYTLSIMKVGETGAMADYTGSRPWESYCSQITSVVVEDGVTSIGNFAFVECTNVSTVTIGNNVTSIGNWAFKECVGLTSVAIGKGVSSIGDEAFSGCINLATITVDGENSTYDSRNSCNAIIETTSNTLVVGCKGTTIPNTVTSIGKQAFQGSGLTSITIPSNVTSIGKFAFDGCSSLATVSGYEGVTSVGSYAFNNTAWLTAQPDGVIYINKVAYLGKNVSGEISINPGTESISPYAFFMKTGLTAITIPASVTSIGDFAFYQCTGLTSITIPAGVTSIGFGAFYECSSLASVTVYASTPPTLDTYTFWDCANLAKIYVPAASLETYKAADNWKGYASKIEGLYTVTFGGSLPDGVTGVATPNIVAAGETVTLSFSDTPTGYTFGGYTAKDAADNDITATAISGSTLTMPASDVTVSVSFKKLLTNTDITIAEIADQTYTGSEIKPAITVKDGTTDITDQCDITYTNNTNVGTATVTIKAKASSTAYAGETEASFKITLTGDINGDKVVNVADIVKAINDGKSQEEIKKIENIIMKK